MESLVQRRSADFALIQAQPIIPTVGLMKPGVVQVLRFVRGSQPGLPNGLLLQKRCLKVDFQNLTTTGMN